MATNDWQKSLRQSIPSAGLARKPPGRRLSVVEDEPPQKPPAPSRRMSKRLNSQAEEVEELPAAKKGKSEAVVKKIVTKVRESILSEQPRIVAKNKEPAVKQRIAKVTIKIPKPLDLSVVKTVREELISPIPLPSGVICIDRPLEDAGLFAYWDDFTAYLKTVEHEWVFDTDVMLKGQHSVVASNRSILVDWLLELGLHFKTCQETVFHTVALIDATLSLRQVEQEHFQLLGITAFLLACKLEEYHPPDIEELLKLTQNSYTFKEVTTTEMGILKALNGRIHIADPTIFINRFIKASLVEDKMFKHAVNLFYDSLLPSLEYSAIKASIKAAASVYTARLVLYLPDPDDGSADEDFQTWTPTLRYYTGYREDELTGLAVKMVSVLSKRLRERLAGKKPSGVMKKYRSNSRHLNVISHPRMNCERAKTVLELLDDIAKV